MTQPRLVGGRYELGELIGYGGMAEVHRGRDSRLGREVAIKVLRADLARDPSFLNRFRREAQSAAGLNHPSIVVGLRHRRGRRRRTARRSPSSSWSTSRAARCATSSRPRAGCRPGARWRSPPTSCGALDFSHRNGHRPPRHQAGQRDDHAEPARSRSWTSASPARSPTTRPPSPRPRTSSAPRSTSRPEQARGETGRRPLGRVLHRLPALRTGHRRAAVPGRFAGRGRLPARAGEPDRCRRARDPSVPRALDSIVMKALAKNQLNRYASYPARKAPAAADLLADSGHLKCFLNYQAPRAHVAVADRGEGALAVRQAMAVNWRSVGWTIAATSFVEFR